MEIDGFLYETLNLLSIPTETTTTTTSSPTSATTIHDSEQPEPYTVYRTQISSPALNSLSPSTTAQDYFSLDVDADEDDDVSGCPQQPSKDSPSPARVFTPKPCSSVNPSLERGWFRANSRFKSPMLQLHKEIIDFCEFLSPTLEEQESRKAAVDSVFDVVKYIWPHCSFEVFGSFKTGLYLPTSDIDVVILDSRVQTPQMGLYALSRALSQRGVGKKIQVIAKARVPIIKFIEKRSGIAFDISFDVLNGPQAAEFIKDAIMRIPPLRPLCLILKVFLQQRELNEVYSGGIGSYTLLAMLIAQLQIHWKGQHFQGYRAALENNLGILLVNFFEFYGRKLNIRDVGISCQGSGSFFLKTKKGFLNEERPHLLCIEDPQAPENDIGRSSFNYPQIRSAFGLAFSTLTSAKGILDLGPNKSILGTIIRPDPVLLERKGGANGQVTFDSLLPGAGEPVQPRFQAGQDIVYNWQLDDDEPLPRNGTPADVGGSHSSRKKRWSTQLDDDEPLPINGSPADIGGSHSSRKKRWSKEKRKSRAKENGDVKKADENGSRKGKKLKKLTKPYRDYTQRTMDQGNGRN